LQILNVAVSHTMSASSAVNYYLILWPQFRLQFINRGA